MSSLLYILLVKMNGPSLQVQSIYLIRYLKFSGRVYNKSGNRRLSLHLPEKYTRT
jgi:hypothetical protein